MASTAADVPIPATAITEVMRSRRAIDRMSEWLTRRSIIPLATVLALAVAAGDVGTGIELPFTILYLLPIVLATWFRSRTFGMLLSVLASGSIAVSLVVEGISAFAITWNVLGAMALFVAASWAVDQLRAHVDRERTLRRNAVEQLRHAERLNLIGTLAAGIAHELGTPLNVIAGCAEFLTVDSTDEGVHQRSRMILAQIDKVSAIIRHLLDFGHRGGVVRTRVDLNAVASAATEMVQSSAQKRGIAITLEHGGPAFVAGNAGELEQVVSNLIVNAVQAMERGTVRVKVRVEQRGEDPVGCIEVDDEGCGIESANLSRIFDPFFTTKGVGEGTGLGLSVSYGIVHDHGGSIEVVSEPGHGSHFTVALPLNP